jgi:multiple sugar transport system substrate-binding protein
MKPDDYGVAPWMKGVRRARLSDHRLWRLVHVRQQRAQGSGLEADRRRSMIPAGSLAWNRRIGALPIYRRLPRTPCMPTRAIKGWFEELADPNVEPMIMPMDLPAWALFVEIPVVPGPARGCCSGKLSRRTWRSNGHAVS